MLSEHQTGGERNTHLNHFIIINASCPDNVSAAGAWDFHHFKLVITMVRMVSYQWAGCLGTLVVGFVFPILLTHTVEAVAILPSFIHL